jgi:arsenate reductase (thioredoxin)
MLTSTSTGLSAPSRVLILCTGNSCRSHLAEGLLRARGGADFEVFSAGSRPAGYVHPLAIRVMQEIGIDLASHRSKSWDEFKSCEIHTVITVCGRADAVCPVFPGQRVRHHWPFEDPAHVTGDESAVLTVFRRVRDEIDRTLQAYVAGHRDASAARPPVPEFPHA